MTEHSGQESPAEVCPLCELAADVGVTVHGGCPHEQLAEPESPALSARDILGSIPDGPSSSEYIDHQRAKPDQCAQLAPSSQLPSSNQPDTAAFSAEDLDEIERRYAQTWIGPLVSELRAARAQVAALTAENARIMQSPASWTAEVVEPMLARADQPDTAAIRASVEEYGNDGFDDVTVLRLCDALDRARAQVAALKEHGDMHCSWEERALQAEAERDTAVALGTPDPVQIASLTHVVRILTAQRDAARQFGVVASQTAGVEAERAEKAEAERDRWREVAEMHNTEFEAVQAKLDAVRALCEESHRPDTNGYCRCLHLLPCPVLTAYRAILDGPTS
jgi:hypothetical protein